MLQRRGITTPSGSHHDLQRGEASLSRCKRRAARVPVMLVVLVAFAEAVRAVPVPVKAAHGRDTDGSAEVLELPGTARKRY